MLKIGFLAKKLSRSFLEFSPKDIREEDIIDKKFANSKDISSFINDIDISTTSTPMLVHSLKISLNYSQRQKLQIKSDKLYDINDEIGKNLNKLDAQDIVNYCDLTANFPLKGVKLISSQEQKTVLTDRINELLLSKKFKRNQILSIYENLRYLGIRIDQLENEIAKIVSLPSTLTLEEISKILIGRGKYIYSEKLDFLNPCLKRIIQLKNYEELDVKYLTKILDTLSYNSNRSLESKTIWNFLEAIRDTLPRWKKNDLLSIVNFYINQDRVHSEIYKDTLEIIYKLQFDEPDADFAINVISLLKNTTHNNIFIDKIISKGLKIINTKLCVGPISEWNLAQILDIMHPNVNRQIAQLLVKYIENKNANVYRQIDWTEKAWKIRVNEEGKLSFLAKYLSFTKNKSLHDRQGIKSYIMDDLKARLDKDITEFCQHAEKMEYNLTLIEALKPLQDKFYSSWELLKNPLKYSMMFYECDPEKWNKFVNENKSKFSIDQINTAIRDHQGSLAAINDLLSIYSDNIPKNLSKSFEQLEHTYESFCKIILYTAMKRMTESTSFEVLNNFSRILNKMDPHYFINDPNFYETFYYFDHLYVLSDFSLLTDLFVEAYNLIKDLPIKAIFSNTNIKIISYVVYLDKLDSKMADLITSNYSLIKDLKELPFLAISSKCSDPKLREIIVKLIFNSKISEIRIRSAILSYWWHPETKKIDEYVINILNKYIPSLGFSGIYDLIITLLRLQKRNINNHINLYNTMLTFIKNCFLKYIGTIRYHELESLLLLAETQLPLDIDFAYIISENQKQSKSYISDDIRDCVRNRLIEKIASVGLSDKDAVEAICDKKNDFKPAYLARTLSCLADLRFEDKKWAIDMANTLIKYEERKKFAFDSDEEYMNWIYGLIVFKANKSIIMRHLENSNYFDCEKLNFKHILLKDHFGLDPDYKGNNILEKKIQEYGKGFDYFKHFGIQKSLINSMQSAANKDNLVVKTGELIENIWVPFYIPSIKIVLWPVTNSILLYRSHIFRGEFAMHQAHILNKLKDLKILNKEDTNRIEKIGIKQFLNVS